MRPTVFILAVAAVLIVSCRNPFFPPSKKVEGEIYRNTPKGVIEQLILSYEERSTSLFRDLIREDFRFYVSRSFESEYSASAGNRSEYFKDSKLQFVTGGTYLYWTYAEEIRAHEGLFAAADQITFSVQPVVNEALFSYTIEVDTTIADTAARGDTTAVEISMLNGEIKIIAGVDHTEYTVDIGQQVFVLGRDPLDSALWIIRRWFDLGTASN